MGNYGGLDKNNGFDPGYCRHVIAYRAKAKWGVDNGAKITRVLKVDGFWIKT